MSKVSDFGRKAGRLLLRLALWFLIVTFSLVLIFKWVPVPYTPLMAIRYFEAVGDGKDLDIKKKWVPIEEISDHLELAVVASEDQHFLKHTGIDFGAIEKAMEENKKRKRPRGASTISQQTAKNVFLWPGRNFVRKGLEVYFTYLIELVWGKERILEVYLNVIEMGTGIFGAEAAAAAHFNTTAAKLSKSQAASIAAVLPNPRKMNAGRPSSYVQKRRGHIMHQMKLFGGRLRWEE